jgi:hypothetical protein
VTAEDFEWIEFLNTGTTALDLENVRFSNGIEFTFGQLSLAGGEHLILAKNPVAFALRNPEVSVTVLGPYLGFLNNDGEQVQLVDAEGENILSFDFNDYWYPRTDGGGMTLVLREENTPFNEFDEAASWGSSIEEGGSVGGEGQGYEIHFNAWQVERFMAAERSDPDLGSAFANPDGDPYPNWQEYAFGLDPRVPDQAVFQSLIVTDQGADYLGALVRLRSLAADLKWNLEISNDGAAWALVPEAPVTWQPDPSSGTQLMTIRELFSVGTSASKLSRLRIEFTP